VDRSHIMTGRSRLRASSHSGKSTGGEGYMSGRRVCGWCMVNRNMLPGEGQIPSCGSEYILTNMGKPCSAPLQRWRIRTTKEERQLSDCLRSCIRRRRRYPVLWMSTMSNRRRSSLCWNSTHLPPHPARPCQRHDDLCGTAWVRPCYLVPVQRLRGLNRPFHSEARREIEGSGSSFFMTTRDSRGNRLRRSAGYAERFVASRWGLGMDGVRHGAAARRRCAPVSVITDRSKTPHCEPSRRAWQASWRCGEGSRGSEGGRGRPALHEEAEIAPLYVKGLRETPSHALPLSLLPARQGEETPDFGIIAPHSHGLAFSRAYGPTARSCQYYLIREVSTPYPPALPWNFRVRGDKERRAELVSRFLKLVSGETVSPSSPASRFFLRKTVLLKEILTTSRT